MRLPVIAFAVIAVFTGCTSTPSPTPVGVCGMVSNMDQLVGKTALGEPGAVTINDVDRCLWTYADNPSRWVTVSVSPKSAHDQAIDAFGDGESVDGLGEDARWFASNSLLSVASGDTVVQVDLELDPEDASQDLAVNIARVALDNLT
jgi:hypothetical protein